MAKQATQVKPATPNFGSLLDKAPSDVERPKPLPVGTYATVVQGLPRFDKSAKKQTEFAEFTLKIISASDDVDQEELAAMGGLADKTMRATFYLTENSLWRLKDFLTDCGLDMDDYNSLREALEDTPGKSVGIFVKHTPSQDGQSVYAEIGKTLPVE